MRTTAFTSRLAAAVAIAIAILLLCGRSAQAQLTPPVPIGPHPYQRFRYDEDYLYLRDPAGRSDFWDPIKYIPLNSAGDSYLSFGGEARLRYERYNNYRFNPASPDDDGYLLQRYLFHTDLHLGPSFRVFAQLQSCLEDWRKGGPRPIDEDQLDFHQLFIDVRLPIDTGDRNEFTLRIGRQEMAYGSLRLIAVRDGPNIRRSFDAVRLLTRVGEWHVDAFFSRPVEEDNGMFDDWGRDDVNFWGVYATRPLPFLKGANVDLYYLGLDRPNAHFVQGTGDEQRHTIGGRFFGTRGPWDYSAEGAFQWGAFGDGDILAGMLAANVGYTFEGVATTPHLSLEAAAISGDTNPNDSTLGTFNPLFPKSAYFGEIALLGGSNLFDLHPSIDLHLTRHFTLTVDWHIFWRYSTDDGIYDPPGNILRPADGDARFMGHQPGVGIWWQIDRHTSFSAVYSHFFAGDFIKESGPGVDVDFVAVWLQYRF